MSLMNGILAFLISLTLTPSQYFVSAVAPNTKFNPMVDYYQILGVDQLASTAEIKHSYKALAKKHHPDVSSEPHATERIAQINEAYEVLSNHQTRSDYDSARNAGIRQLTQRRNANKAKNGFAYNGGRNRHTYVYRSEGPDQYYEFYSSDPEDFYNFYTSQYARRNPPPRYEDTEYVHETADSRDVSSSSSGKVNSRPMDLITPLCILLIELAVVHTVVRAVMPHYV
ncbi:DnaJ sub C member 24 [Perkinsus chesapeaki]|uniref:DnaJ sub C member 24 n=1 Tax=Perkinsus chesapeaki TaxID=330153 RepID=A0A7J6MT10_PERCH|nr:DnaJ sub C member 24 [Perkinsus chesapeaki]